MSMDIVKAADRAHVVPQCTCDRECVDITAPVVIVKVDPTCPIHGAHFSDADVDDEPTE